jgi:hypothetical protein
MVAFIFMVAGELLTGLSATDQMTGISFLFWFSQGEIQETCGTLYFRGIKECLQGNEPWYHRTILFASKKTYAQKDNKKPKRKASNGRNINSRSHFISNQIIAIKRTQIMLINHVQSLIQNLRSKYIVHSKVRGAS